MIVSRGTLVIAVISRLPLLLALRDQVFFRLLWCDQTYSFVSPHHVRLSRRTYHALNSSENITFSCSDMPSVAQSPK
jgi:hypothetical protein